MNAKNSKGFTLVEIAIVLVIVGLLLGGVLKGQEMINNAKLKRITTDFDGISAAVFSYQDRYNTVPGDDNTASVRWPGASNGNNNGAIAGGWNSTNNANESRIFWHQLRNSNLIPGATAGAASFNQPRNSYGGMIGVEDTNYGLAGMVVCMGRIDGTNAAIIDTQNDDGIPSTGSIRANTANNANAGSADYTAVIPYNICRKL